MQPIAAQHPRAAQLSRYEELVNRRSRTHQTGNQAPVIQGLWVWNAKEQWWEENQEGYVYDPETGDWQWGDEGEHQDPEAVHATYRQRLLAIMNREELREYFEDAGHNDDVREYLDFQTANLPGNQDITEVDTNTNPLIFDEDEEGANVAVMPEQSAAVPVATLADEESFVASEGAGPCVIAFLRMRSTDGRTFLGASHLTTDDLRDVDTAIASMTSLYEEVEGEMDEDEDVAQADAYLIGGEDSDDVEGLMEYARLIQALREMPYIRLAGARLPASGEDQYVDARMDADTIEFGVFDKDNDDEPTGI